MSTPLGLPEEQGVHQNNTSTSSEGGLFEVRDMVSHQQRNVREAALFNVVCGR